MRIILLILTMFFPASLTFSQSDTNNLLVDEMPTFKKSTGLASFRSYLYKKIDLSDIQDDLISGRVTVQFCVDSTGKTTDIKIIESLRDDIDNAVIKAIKKSPRWIPGKKNGEPVDVLYIMPLDLDFQN